MIFRRIIFSSLLVGLITGSIYGFFQQTQITPVIRAAEQFEINAGAVAPQIVHNNNHTHSHIQGRLKPSPGVQRLLFSLGSDILIAIAFALILISLMTMHNVNSVKPGVNLISGLFWGGALMITIFIAPWISGLKPALPGSHGVQLPHRQALWLISVSATGLGIAMLYYIPTWHKFIGIALLLIPHYLIQPGPTTLVIANTNPEVITALNLLTREFHLKTFIGMLIFCLLLGALSGFAVNQSNRE